MQGRGFASVGFAPVGRQLLRGHRQSLASSPLGPSPRPGSGWRTSARCHDLPAPVRRPSGRHRVAEHRTNGCNELRATSATSQVDVRDTGFAARKRQRVEDPTQPPMAYCHLREEERTACRRKRSGTGWPSRRGSRRRAPPPERASADVSSDTRATWMRIGTQTDCSAFSIGSPTRETICETGDHQHTESRSTVTCIAARSR